MCPLDDKCHLCISAERKDIFVNLSDQVTFLLSIVSVRQLDLDTSKWDRINMNNTRSVVKAGTSTTTSWGIAFGGSFTSIFSFFPRLHFPQEYIQLALAQGSSSHFPSAAATGPSQVKDCKTKKLYISSNKSHCKIFHHRRRIHMILDNQKEWILEVKD